MTSSITIQTFEATLTHHCRNCGAEFTVDEIRGEIDRLVVRLTVHNTGEHGRIALNLETSHVYSLDAEEAAEWLDQYPRLWAQDRGYEINERVNRLYYLYPSAESRLPANLGKGETWQGRFETLRRPIPGTAVGLFFVFGPFQHVDSGQNRWSFVSTVNVPYVSLKEPVAARELTGASRTWSRVKGGIHKYSNRFLTADRALIYGMPFVVTVVLTVALGSPLAIMVGVASMLGTSFWLQKNWLRWKAMLPRRLR